MLDPTYLLALACPFLFSIGCYLMPDKDFRWARLCFVATFLVALMAPSLWVSSLEVVTTGKVLWATAYALLFAGTAGAFIVRVNRQERTHRALKAREAAEQAALEEGRASLETRLRDAEQKAVAQKARQDALPVALVDEATVRRSLREGEELQAKAKKDRIAELILEGKELSMNHLFYPDRDMFGELHGWRGAVLAYLKGSLGASYAVRFDDLRDLPRPEGTPDKETVLAWNYWAHLQRLNEIFRSLEPKDTEVVRRDLARFASEAQRIQQRIHDSRKGDQTPTIPWELESLTLWKAEVTEYLTDRLGPDYEARFATVSSPTGVWGQFEESRDRLLGIIRDLQNN